MILTPEFVNSLESLPDGVVVVDQGGTIVYSNSFLERMFGYDRGELTGRSVEDLIPVNLRQLHATHRANYNAAPQTRSMGSGMDLSAIRKDGSVFPVEIGLSQIITPIGPRVVAIVTDITKRKRAEDARNLAERALRMSEERYRSLFENAVFGIFRTSPSGEILDVNAAMVKMLGCENVEEVRQLDFTREVLRNIESEGPDSFEVEWKTKQGRTIQVRLSGTKVRDENGLPVYYEAIAEDISQSRLLERQYQQAQKMEAVGRLAGGIAHDFNNLLTIVGMNSEALLESMQSDESFRETAAEAMEQINRAVEQGSGLVRQLMAFSRKDQQNAEPVSVQHLLTSSERMLRMLASEAIQLTVQCETDNCFITITPTHFEQIMMNLVTNARDAMSRGGKIRVMGSLIDLDDDTAAPFVGLKPGKHVRLSIEDTGCGMTADILPNIFEPFFTTKERGKGTGLGLSTVYALVRQYSGHIGCESTPGDGTTFTILFPAATARAEKHQPTTARAAAQRGTETVLLVDDEETLRITVRRILENTGYTVITAGDGIEALRIIETGKASFDLLITDVALPYMRGPELAQRLAGRFPGTKVLYMSGYDEGSITSDLKHSFIAKPFKREALVQKVRDVLDGAI